MSNKYNENNASMSHCDCRAPVLPSPDAVSDPRKIRAFRCFLSGEEGGEGGFLLTKVNARADERRRAGLRRAYFLGCNMLSSSGLHGG